MELPKISVLTPMYNRKHYIAQAVDSVLNQTFQDFELIIRDDGSTDGSAEFVEERYAEQIASGKIKLRRNEKNIGEFPTDNRLIREATGKYFMILHSDDFYMPDGMEHMYTVAEQYQADVVHSTRHYRTAHDGSLDNPSSLKLGRLDKRPVTEITVMSNDPVKRFSQWMWNIGIDVHHNIINRDFFMENDFSFEVFGGNRLLSLKLFMRAKVLVMTPESFYVYRRSPDSQTRAKCPPERVAKQIEKWLELARHLDKYFAEEEFFRNNKKYQYLTQSHLFSAFDVFWIMKRGVYKNGVTMELNDAVEEVFRKEFGESAGYLAFLFHWVHTQQAKIPIRNIIVPPPADTVQDT